MKELYYLCAQPASQYYAWQVEVMLENFLENGIDPEKIHILCAVLPGAKIAEAWNSLTRKYDKVSFMFYFDERETKNYVSSIRPHILAKHFKIFPHLKENAVFYHDCDVLFTKPIDWSQFLNDEIWYCSKTESYISDGYIKSKGFGIYEKMCEIIGIDESIPESNRGNSGGAQYIIKNVDSEFWEKVEKDCESLYTYFMEHLKEHPQTETYHPIQAWTADMWAVLWNGWKFNHEVKVVPEMNFCWPTHPQSWWETNNIFHNASITPDMKEEYFYKGDYRGKLPYNIDISKYKRDSCSYKYAEKIIEVGNKSCITIEELDA